MVSICILKFIDGGLFSYATKGPKKVAKKSPKASWLSLVTEAGILVVILRQVSNTHAGCSGGTRGTTACHLEMQLWPACMEPGLQKESGRLRTPSLPLHKGIWSCCLPHPPSPGTWCLRAMQSHHPRLTECGDNTQPLCVCRADIQSKPVKNALRRHILLPSTVKGPFTESVLFCPGEEGRPCCGLEGAGFPALGCPGLVRV